MKTRLRVHVQNVPICTDTTRTHVETCVRVVPVQTGTFCSYTRRRAEWTHGFFFLASHTRQHNTIPHDTTTHNTTRRQRQRQRQTKTEKEDRDEDSNFRVGVHTSRVILKLGGKLRGSRFFRGLSERNTS